MNDLLTTILGTFQSKFAAGADVVAGMGLGVLFFIMVIDVILSHIFNLEEDHFNILCRNFVKYGFWMYLLQNYSSLKEEVMDGFILVATEASQNAAVAGKVFQPSYIIDIGYTLMDKVYGFVLSTQTGGGFIGNTINLLWSAANGELTVAKLFPNFFYWIVSLFIGLAFCIMAWQIFMTLLEFHLIGALVPIFLPFGAFRKTAFLAESAIGAIISAGVKMMVLVFIMATAIPIIEGWTTLVNAQPTQRECVQLLGGCMAVALLSWVAPNVASGLMSGRPSLTAATAAGAAMATAYLAQKVASGVKNTARGGTSGGSKNASDSGPTGGSGLGSDVKAATNVQTSRSL